MHVTQLYVYPVKGLRGIPLQAATLGPQGIRHDRRFMLMTSHRSKNGQTKMQLAAYPECALFSQALDGDEVVVRYHPPAAKPIGSTSTMATEAPPPLRIPLAPATAGLAPWAINLHGSPTTGLHMGAAYDAWFGACFGFDVVLVYIGAGRRAVLGKTLQPRKTVDGQRRGARFAGGLHSIVTRTWLVPGVVALLAAAWLAVLAGGWMALLAYMAAVTGVAGVRLRSADGTDEKERGEDDAPPWLTFTDCAPLLVTSEASRRNVNGRLSAGLSVPMAKFRPNIVVDGEDAWSEDFWAELAVHGTDADAGQDTDFRLLLTSNCARCTSLNVDYDTGAPAAGELGQVLKRLSKDRRVDAGSKYSPIFGRYAFLDGGRAVHIAVGDAVAVTQRNKERTVWDWPGL